MFDQEEPLHCSPFSTLLVFSHQFSISPGLYTRHNPLFFVFVGRKCRLRTSCCCLVHCLCSSASLIAASAIIRNHTRPYHHIRQEEYHLLSGLAFVALVLTNISEQRETFQQSSEHFWPTKTYRNLIRAFTQLAKHAQPKTNGQTYTTQMRKLSIYARLVTVLCAHDT